MGKIGFANCQDVRNQKKIRELDCPRCHEPGGIEAFGMAALSVIIGALIGCIMIPVYVIRAVYVFLRYIIGK